MKKSFRVATIFTGVARLRRRAGADGASHTRGARRNGCGHTRYHSAQLPHQPHKLDRSVLHAS